MRYLSELFLSRLGTDFSRESVQAAVQECEKEFNERLEEIPTETGKILYLLDEPEKPEENPHFREVLDFWDAAKDCEGEDMEQYEIFRLARCVNRIYQERKG